MRSSNTSATSASASNCRIVYIFLGIILLWVPGINVSGQSITGKTFVVSPEGSDINTGTATQPFATFEAARNAARKTEHGNNRIYVMPGDYYLDKPLELDSRDNGLTIIADTTGDATLYGGSQVTGWRRDGEKFWCADLPGVKEGTWYFRAIVVNGRMPEVARIPETGTFLHQNIFDVPWLGTVGGWARMPTDEELTVMRYDPKDIPNTLDVKNAELRVYHYWNESLVGLKHNDTINHKLTFSKSSIYPPGGWRKKDYIIYNTREGMTKPGRWYLDITNGRLVYWPLEGEDMANSKIIAPKIERIISITGDPDKKAENISIQGLKFQVTIIPQKSATVGRNAFEGAISMMHTQKCNLENLEISNAGGIGILAMNLSNCRITNCHIHNTGSSGARIGGTEIFFAHNHIHNVGISYPSSVGLSASGSRNHIYRNEIHDSPYCGMTVGRNDILVEENLIYRVMCELRDGAAIYSIGGKNCIFRGNVVRDITAHSDGYAGWAFYLDEDCFNCVVEKNTSYNVAKPTHNHIARNSIIRNNVFITDKDMTLSFVASSNMTFQGNTLLVPGKIGINSPNGIGTWKGNKIFSNGLDKNNLPQAFKIDSSMPVTPVPSRKTRPVEVIRAIKTPTIDGELATDEWTGVFQSLDREPTRFLYSGAPVMVKFSRDNKYLYIGAMMIMFDIANISMGDKWGKDDGVEISVRGFDKGKPATYVIRAYTNGTIQSVTDAGATALAAEHLGKTVRYASKVIERPRKGWIGEWAIPLEAIGLKPKPDMKVAFNMCAYVNEYDKWHCLEGTLGENWQVDEAGILTFK